MMNEIRCVFSKLSKQLLWAAHTTFTCGLLSCGQAMLTSQWRSWRWYSDYWSHTLSWTLTLSCLVFHLVSNCVGSQRCRSADFSLWSVHVKAVRWDVLSVIIHPVYQLQSLINSPPVDLCVVLCLKRYVKVTVVNLSLLDIINYPVSQYYTQK